MALYQYEIGTTQENMQNLEDLGVRPPAFRYKPHSEGLQLLERGKVRGMGYAWAAWVYKTLSRAERDTLRTFCPGSSALVYIKTRTNDNSEEYKTFTAWMTCPEEQREMGGLRTDFTVEFHNLTEVA